MADVFMHHYGIKEDGNVNPMKVTWVGRCNLGGWLGYFLNSFAKDIVQLFSGSLVQPVAQLLRDRTL